jgi:DNA-binding NtrC family response regulator
VIPIHLPPLRDRKTDIPFLANYFLSKFNKLKKGNIGKVKPEAMESLTRYPWPGNVRELENLIEMLVVMKNAGDIDIADLPPKILNSQGKEPVAVPASIPEEGVDFNALVYGFEKDLLLKALSKAGGAKKSAAKLLNLNRTTFVEKLKRLNIS